MNWEEACRILGVKETASDIEIRAQYLYKAQLLHPDVNQDRPEIVRNRAAAELALVNPAHDFLKDPRNNPFKIPPKLEITPKNIRFKDVELGQKKRTTFEIRSIDGPYTNIWIDNEPAPWLSIAGVRSLTNEQLPLEVTIESTGMGEPDTQYSCNLLVKLENEKTKLKSEKRVRIELWTKAEPAILLANKNAIEMKQIRAGDTKVRTFELSNIGRGLLKGDISTSKPWLSVQPNTIDIAPSGKHLYTVTVKTSSLPYGFEDKDLIYLNSNAGNYAIPIDISIATKAEPVDFSFSEFWRTLGKFILYPIGFFCFTIPLSIFLYNYKTVFWAVVVAYAAVALLVAIISGRGGNR